MSSGWWLLLLATLALFAVAVFPGPRLRTLYLRWREFRNRATLEDALKHLHHRAEQGVGATPESVSGALGISPRKTMDTLMRLEAQGLLRNVRGRIHLSDDGAARARQVVRAHRLWETYLSREAQVPLEYVHGAAERIEHSLSGEQLERLDAELGYPRRDPHGDPIPDAEGRIAPIDTTPLSDWPVDHPAIVIHLEDEPDTIFRQIPQGLRKTGNVVEVESRTAEALMIRDGAGVYQLSPLVAANIHVGEVPETKTDTSGLIPLAELAVGKSAEIALLDDGVQGLTRRRLLDLGLTPGARVECYLQNPFGDPQAYRVRGTMIALRKDQSSRIWVRPAAPHPAEAEATLRDEGGR